MVAQIIALVWAVVGGGLWVVSFFRERKKAETAPPVEYQIAGLELADMKPARDLVRTLAPRLERVFELAEQSTASNVQNHELLTRLIRAQEQVKDLLEHIEQRMMRDDIRAEERDKARQVIRAEERERAEEMARRHRRGE